MDPGLLGDVDSLFLVFIEVISRIIELGAVLLIFGSIIIGSARYYLNYSSEKNIETITAYRQYIGQWLLLGLELLVAADVIRTVTLDLTLEGIASLGLLVLVRTFLSWSLVVEMEGRWPWQPVRRKKEPETHPNWNNLV